MPPWLGAIDHSLSLTTMMRPLPNSAALSRPSKARPPESEPSPMTATTSYFSPARSRALARPQARLTEVEVWPIEKRSCSDSRGLEKPETSSKCSGSRNACARPVSILCG